MPTAVPRRRPLVPALVRALGGLAAAWLLVAVPAGAAPVDLSTWTEESYPAVGGFSPGDWEVATDGESVTQQANGQPTIFHSDFSARNTDVTGTIEVLGGDDDYVGFVLGFSPGDTTSATADYLLLDWKRGTQTFDFGGSPGANATPGTTAQAGLAVSRVTGIPTADELWGHVSFLENAAGSVNELARATTLGSTGWSTTTAYEFRFVYTPSELQVFVDDVLEISITGSFPDGRLGFYNFSQGGVRYSAFESESIPEPGMAVLLGAALGGLALARRTGVWRR